MTLAASRNSSDSKTKLFIISNFSFFFFLGTNGLPYESEHLISGTETSPNLGQQSKFYLLVFSCMILLKNCLNNDMDYIHIFHSAEGKQAHLASKKHNLEVKS